MKLKNHPKTAQNRQKTQQNNALRNRLKTPSQNLIKTEKLSFSYFFIIYSIFCC